MNATRTLSIHSTWKRANLSAVRQPESAGAWVELGAKGTTAEKPWAVVAPVRKSRAAS